MAEVSSNKCNICEEVDGNLYCNECQNILCDKCRAWHDKFPGTKKHIVVALSQVDKEQFATNALCDKHESDLIYFCDNCNCLTCRFCTTTNHKGHIFSEVSEIASMKRDLKKNELSTLNSEIQKLSTLIFETKSERLTQLQNDKENYDTAADKFVDDLKNVISSLATCSKSCQNDRYIKEKKDLDNKITDLEKCLNEYEMLKNEFEKTIKEIDDAKFYIKQSALEKKLRELDQIPIVKDPNSIGWFNPDEFVSKLIDFLLSKTACRQIQKQEKVKYWETLSLSLDRVRKRSEELETRISLMEQENAILLDKLVRERNSQIEFRRRMMTTLYELRSFLGLEKCRASELLSLIPNSKEYIQLFVKQDVGEKQVFIMMNPSETVKAIKLSISAKLSISSLHQDLYIFGTGKELKDDKLSLENYGLCNNMTIVVKTRVKPTQ